MELLIVLAACIVWWFVYSLGRELLAEAKSRRETRIWVAWEREEAARAHQRRLAAIEAVRLNGLEELRRIAAEARGEIIEGTCREVRRP